MPHLFFVTPVYRRFRLTKICLEQRRWVCDQIRERYGYDATCVVIGDDENLDTARALGFHAVERDNQWLGRKFNDGYAHAAENDATHVFAIGSDSWIDPGYFHRLPPADTVRVSRPYAMYPPKGDRRGELMLTNPMGVSFIWPLQLIKGRNRRLYRPCDEEIARGCDTSTFTACARKDTTVEYQTGGHQLELVAFQSSDTQISSYDRLCRRWGVNEVTDRPFDDLHRYYPAALIDRVQDYYATGTDTGEGG